MGLKCLKNCNNPDAIALSYPLFLFMIHHEEAQGNPNHNPNPNLKGGYESAIAPKPCLLPELWLLKYKTWLFLYFLLTTANN